MYHLLIESVLFLLLTLVYLLPRVNKNIKSAADTLSETVCSDFCFVLLNSIVRCRLSFFSFSENGCTKKEPLILLIFSCTCTIGVYQEEDEMIAEWTPDPLAEEFTDTHGPLEKNLTVSGYVRGHCLEHRYRY